MKELLKLPIDDVIPEIKTAIASGHDVILRASPGSGKTTRVPPAMLSALPGKIWVLEPRRIAARMSALRVAEEMNQRPGMTVGWQMRFDHLLSAETRLLFLTEGMFTALLTDSPSLTGVSCVILDEFHERHQQTDVALALLRQLQATSRPDLRLIIMSATLDTEELISALPKAKVISIDIPLYPVRVEHWQGDGNDSLVDRAVRGVQKLAEDPRHKGHILVFLPGTAEILRVKSALQRFLQPSDWLLMELRASLEKSTQDLVFSTTKERKIILATNIAESSITIPGVTGVVDTGVARVPSYNIFSGMSTLETRPISRASIIQRSGRAGRTAPGIAIRLFSKHDEAARPQVESPEILRLDLAGVYLSLLAIGEKTKSACTPDALPWLSSPEQKSWDEAKKLLTLLKFISSDGRLIASQQAHLPVHPRIARFAFALIDEGTCDEAPWLAALLASPDEVTKFESDHSHLGCDLLARYDSLRRRPNQFPNTVKAARQIAHLLKLGPLKRIDDCRAPHELHLSNALLRAFPDRVMIIRNKAAKTNWLDATLSGGGDVRLTKGSAAAHGDWVIALDASSSRVSGSVAANQYASSTAQITVTSASQITLEDLVSTVAEALSTETIQEWDEKHGKSRTIKRTKYGVLVVSSQIVASETVDHESAESSDAELRKQILKQWPKPFESSEEFDGYIIRQRLAFEHKLVTHVWDKDELLQLLVAQICDEAKSFQEIAARPLTEWIRSCVGEDEFSLLQRITPTSITVGAGHKVKVHYSDSSPPWIEARLQNFFGQAVSPTILNGRLPLTLHLLAPNMRALQVTTDLVSFWEKVYPSLRNEYARRYPRHFWPENPLQADPPPPRPQRPRK